MSRKKNKKKKLEISNSDVVAETSVPSKKEQIAKMIFQDFLKNAMKIFDTVDNDYLSVVPYIGKDAEEKDDGTDIVCYEIVSKSNEGVVVYVDDKDIYVSLDGAGVTLDDDELAYLAANVLDYVRKHYPTAA